ncbi:nitrite reductase [Paenibacillus darwinianus]|uniref:Nitrite reductase n=1 Tax=Paenibacillus darwinianus TaxID=1380763 RepID=A0A9W5S1F5_9BACL|nr:nitrite reductase [Paenibacillus darwinianus]EXX87940.1 nitrite reductase [Paenibacillus darwinianus]EXX88348.1 nitrite reductase [Paenibacillus darwinianus]EXX88388.1 nitrite reductase [Paenibacillus darwinianus]
MGTTKFAVTPGFEVGGTLFKPEQLQVLGSIVGEDAKIELTTFKQLYVEMSEDGVEQAKKKLRESGLEIHPAGFYTKSLITCNFCKGAEEAGLQVAVRLNEAIGGHEVPSPLKIGFSGCALATGEPLLKDIGVVKMRDAYDIYIGGEGKTLRAVLGSLFMQDVPEDKLIPVVERIIRFFQANGKKKEKFSKFIERVSLETIREAAAV